MSEPKLTEAQREALYDALHADIDGDFLVGADGFGEDIAMQHAGAADVTRWAVNALVPVVARMVAEAEQVARAEAWDRAFERARPWMKLVEELTEERDEARAQAVQTTTEADDLRARLIALAEAWEAYGTVPGQPSREVRAALDAPSRAGTAPVSASSASVDPSATPDLLGPQIGAQDKAAMLAGARERLRLPARADSVEELEARAGYLLDAGFPCHRCGDADTTLVAFARDTSLLVRRIQDLGHYYATDLRCVDCIADMAKEVAASPRHGWHPDFGGPGMDGDQA